MRIVASRGSMDLGDSDGGLPPDELVEDIDAILADTERLAALADGDRVQIAVAPCSPFSVTTRLMEESAALARRLGLAAAHAPRRDGRGGGLLPRALRLHAGRVPRARRLARRRRLVRALRPPLATARSQRFARHGRRRRALPDLEPAPRRRRRAVRELLDAGVRVGLGVDGSASNERSDLFLEVKQALLVARGRGGGGAMTAREALRLGTRGGAARARAATTSARSSPASAPTSRSGAPTASSSAAPTTSSAASSSRRRTASTGCSSAARRSCATARSCGADEQEIAREHRIQARGSGRMTVSTHVLDTERGARPRASASSSARGRRARRRGRDRRRRPHPRARRRPSRARTGSSSTRPRRSSAASSSRSSSATGHHHVPLLVSSYACASYRGS